VTSTRADEPTAAPAAPSGRQYGIAHGDHAAVITQVGATLREYTVRGRPVIDGFGTGQRATDGRGQVLAPWPNRLAAGRYTFGDRQCQAPLTEPERGNAIHGLVRFLDWAEITYTADEVVLGCDLRPQPGYEWQLHLEIGYRLTEKGLTVTANVVNTGDEKAPFGLGFHPYLTLGTDVDPLLLHLPARTHLPAPDDPDERPSPVALAGTPLDFRTTTPIGTTHLDTAFGDLERDPGGRALADLSDANGGRHLQLWVSAAFRYLMVYTADDVHAPERRRRAVAIEPMTCPPNAFRSGTDVITLAPAETWRGEWGLTAIG
jgi:aldose 1-epimerase